MSSNSLKHSSDDYYKKESPDNSVQDEESTVQEGTLDAYLAEQLAAEQDCDIKYRTCGLFKTTALLFSEYSVLAIVSFPWAFSILGLIPGIILTIGIALLVLYCGLVMWEFCLKNPTVLDVCDIGEMIYGARWAWYFTAICFVLNNTFIMGLHLLTWSEYINTMAGHPFCTIISTFIGLVVCILCSLPRTLSNLTWLAVFSAVTMFVSAIMCAIFAGVQDAPGNIEPSKPVEWGLWPKPGTSYVDGMGAMLNIMFTFVGQVTYPTFIAEMKNPRQFHLALKMVTAMEIITFTLVGSITYVYCGQYAVAPAFGSLQPIFKKIAFSFALPTTIFCGVLYCTVTARLVFFRLFRGTRHLHENTTIGWLGWIGILTVLWTFSFIICECIPFFSSLLSLMSSLFDSYFGGVFMGSIYIYMRRQEGGAGWWKRVSLWGAIKLAFNIFIIGLGFYLLGPGTYSTVQTIIDGFHAGTIGGAFSCDDNSL